MKNIQKAFYTLLALLLISPIVQAQDETPAPTAVLNNADISRFITSFKPLVKDLEALDMKYVTDLDVSDPATNMAKSYAASAEVRAILNKYGWNDDFAGKFTAICAGYAYVQMGKEMNIDEVPKEQQEMVRQVLAQTGKQFKQLVHDKDISLVESRFGDLKKVMEDD